MSSKKHATHLHASKRQPEEIKELPVEQEDEEG